MPFVVPFVVPFAVPFVVVVLKFQHEATTHSGAGEKVTHYINVVGEKGRQAES